MSPEALRLGAFTLTEPLGRGGMATVWAARHGPTGTPVAVKVARADEASSPRRLALFRAEVEAVARLTHPGIVQVLDHGVVPEAFGALSPGSAATEALRPGLPYLVMERASLGSLKDRPPPRRWRELRAVLLGILDALGHAHAAGLLHRDLKPENVLLCGPRDPRPGLKLADFGAASAFRGQPRDHVVVGTPVYMAPEHRAGRWREQGPPTDLYAVGCLAWLLASGRLPKVAVRDAGRLPELHPRLPVPPGLRDWLAALLAPDPRLRPATAAEAAWTLLQLGPAPPQGQLSAGSAPHEEPGLAEASTVAETWVGLLSGSRPVTVAAPSLSPVGRALPERRPAVPMPPSWRSEEATLGGGDLPMLGGAGLALFGLRTLPLVGRERAQDALWRAARASFLAGRTGLSVVRGPAGVGRSRLLQWLATAASEVGAASTWTLGRDADGAPSPGSLLARVLRTWGLSGEALGRHLQARLRTLGLEDAVEREALARELHPFLDAMASLGGGGSGFEAEAVGLLARLLRAMAASRPVLLLIDDVHLEPGLRRLALALRADEEAAGWRPLHVVLSVPDEALAASPELAPELHLLGGSVVHLAPLPPPRARDLLSGVVGLHPSLAGRVLAAAGGLPAVLVGAVEAWNQQGLLVLRDDRLDLAPGTPAALPGQAPHQLLQRLRATLGEATWSGGGRELLELAAALGGCPEPGALERAAARLGLPLLPGLEAPLVRAGLARRGRARPTTWTFASPVIHEALAAHAREAGRWAACCGAAAEELGAGPRTPAVQEQRGLLLDEAGQPGEALDLILEAAIQRAMAFEWERAFLLLDRLLAAAERSGLPKDSERYGRLLGIRLTMLNNAGEARRTVAASEALEALARRHGWRLEEGRALSLRGSVLMELGEPEAAGALMRRALTIFDPEADAFMVLQSKSRLASLAATQGRLDEALDWLDDLEAHAHGAARPRFRADALGSRAHVHHLRGEVDRARTLYEAALSAEHDYPGRDVVPVRLGLARLCMEEGHLEEARAQVDAAEAHAREHLLVQSLAYALATRLRLLAASGSLGPWDATLGRLQHILRLTRVAAPGIVDDLRAAGEALPDEAAGRRRVLGELLEELSSERPPHPSPGSPPAPAPG